MCDITQHVYLWHHTLYAYDISNLYRITRSLMKTQPLCNFIATMSDFTSRVSTSQPLTVWYHVHYMWHHIHNLGPHTTLCKRSGPLYLTSLPLYLCHHKHRIDDITANIWMTSHPVYLYHHIHNICGIVSTKYDITILCVDDATLGICMTSFALQMTSPPLYHTKSDYLWCHIHFGHDNTAPVSDITPTVSMSSNTLQWHLTRFFITSYPPSVWHHMNYI